MKKCAKWPTLPSHISATTWSWEESEAIPETTRAITYLNSENLMSPPPPPKRVGGGGIQLKTFKFFHFNTFPYLDNGKVAAFYRIEKLYLVPRYDLSKLDTIS